MEVRCEDRGEGDKKSKTDTSLIFRRREKSFKNFKQLLIITELSYLLHPFNVKNGMSIIDMYTLNYVFFFCL